MGIPSTEPSSRRGECVCSTDLLMRDENTVIRHTFTDQPCKLVIEFLRNFGSKESVGSFSMKCPDFNIQNRVRMHPKHAASFLEYFQLCYHRGNVIIYSAEQWEEKKPARHGRDRKS